MPTTGIHIYDSPGKDPRCLHCLVLLSGHADLAGGPRAPQAGDFALCAHCGGLNIYTEVRGHLVLRLPTAAELAEVEAEFPGVRAQVPALRDELRQAGLIVRYPWERG